MIRLLTGDNSFALGQRVKEIKNDFSSKSSDNGITQVDASDIEADELNGLLTNASLFSEKSLVIVKNIDDNKQIAEALPDMLDLLASDTDLVLVSAKPDKRTRWYKSASQKAKTEELNEKKEHELGNWVVSRAKELGAELRPSDAELLVAKVGLNQARIDNEINKLAAYDPKITKENIELLVEKTLEESVFDLIDTVVKGRSKRAHAMYDELLLIDIDAFKFIGLLSWQLHNLLVVKTNDTMPVSQLSSQSGMAPFVVNKSRRLASSLSLEQIKRMIGLTLEADTDIKKTRADSNSRIKLLIDKVSLLAAGKD